MLFSIPMKYLVNTVTQRKQRGFTLIEMVVVVSIIVVTTGVALANFTRFNDRQQVLTTTDTIKTLIRSAQRKAQAQDTPAACTGSNPLQAYRVYITSSQLLMGANCGDKNGLDEDNPPDGEDVNIALIGDIQQFQIPSGLTVHTNFDVRFWVLYGGVEIIDDAVVSISKGSYRYEFGVSNSGEIAEGDWVEN